MASDDMTPAETEASPPSAARPSVARVLLAIAILAVIVVGLTFFRDVDPVAATETVADADAPRRVLVTRARRAPAEVELRLPGSTRAVEESLVLARASGYVSRLTVDLGDSVTAGQVLAELRAPETMDELRAAEARVTDATENLNWARQSSERIATLGSRGVSTAQELDNAQLAVSTAQAALRASTADAARLRSMRRYQTVVAPFSGVVTERFVDVGAMVSASSGSPLFRVSSLDRIEVVFEVPQTYAALVRVGQTIAVERPDAPGQVVTSTVTRLAGDLTTTTRTMRVESNLPSTEGLLGGMFVNVRLHVERPAPPVVVPARALAVTGAGMQVWVVEDNVAHARAVTIARDLGRDIELATGLEGTEMVILSPPDGLAENDAVETVERTPPTAPPGAPSPAGAPASPAAPAAPAPQAQPAPAAPSPSR